MFTHSKQFYLTYRTLSGATTLGQSRPGSDSNEGVLYISQSSCITEALPSNCLVSYPGHSLGEFAEMQLVYSTDPPANWAKETLSVEEKVLELQESSQEKNEFNYKWKVLAVKGKKNLTKTWKFKLNN